MTLRRRITLQLILGFDAVTCALMGGALVTATEFISRITLINEQLLFWVGFSLFPIAAFMAFFSRKTLVPAWSIQLIVFGNILWVLASVALPVLGIIYPNLFGFLFIFAQAAIVAVFATIEWRFRLHFNASLARE